MKDRKDLEERLMLELKCWHTRQCRNEYDDFYLYYLPTTAEHDGGILICKDKPPNPDYLLAMPERINKAQTVEQNFNRIRHYCLYQLPILSIR